MDQNAFAQGDLVNMHAKIAKKRALAKINLRALQSNVEEVRRVRDHISGALQACEAQADKKAQNCCAKFKAALPVVLGVTQSLSSLAQLGLNTAGKITGNPTLSQVSSILGDSQSLLNNLGSQVINAQKVTDYLKTAVNATGDALKIAGGATNNSQLSKIGSAVIATGSKVADAGDSKNVQEAIAKLSNAAAEALKQTSKITEDSKFDSIGNLVQQAGNALSGMVPTTPTSEASQI